MITKLNINAIQDGSISHYKLEDSEHFKTFETEEEYITAKKAELIVSPCVVYIEESDKTLFYSEANACNAKIIISELFLGLIGNEMYNRYGYIPIAMNPHYYEYFEVDGEDALSSNVESIDGTDAIVLYKFSVGDEFNISFKLKDDIEPSTGTEMDLCLLYACASYLEIDESFYNKLVLDSITYPVGFTLPSVGPDFICKFIGDFLLDQQAYDGILPMFVYLFMAASAMAPDQQFTLNLQIPQGNITYGNITDKFNEETGEHRTFCGVINYLYEVYESPSNVNIIIETY